MSSLKATTSTLNMKENEMKIIGNRTYVLCGLGALLMLLSSFAVYAGDVETAEITRRLGEAAAVAAIAALRAAS